MKQKSYAKVNIFLKITGLRGAYHEIASRFMIVKSLFDEIEFVKDDPMKFNLKGEFGCEVEQNSIYKAYLKLKEISPKVEEFFKIHSIKVSKNIPEFAGLGGGSSNCAAMLNMCNNYIGLGLSKDELANIGATIGADVAFFVYGYESANVSGIGEIVEQFEEKALDIEIFTPQIKCDTARVYQEFRANFYKTLSSDEQKLLFEKKSLEILDSFDIKEANDLYLPALVLQAKLEEIYQSFSNQGQEKVYFSGSGSSFFRIING